MKLNKLPGFTQNWIEFTAGHDSENSGLNVPEQIKSLVANRPQALNWVSDPERLVRLLRDSWATGPARTYQNIEQLQRPESVVVIADIPAGLFYGPVYQALKCMTAVRMCEELVMSGTAAIPVCWIGTGNRTDNSQWSVNLLDQDAELFAIDEEFTAGCLDPSLWKPLSALLSQIEEMGRGSFDSEILEMLRSAYAPEATMTSAFARLVADLMGEWGLVVLDSQSAEMKEISAEVVESLERSGSGGELRSNKREPQIGAEGPIAGDNNFRLPDYVLQSLLMPVIAHVVDSEELDLLLDTQPVFDALGCSRPAFWPSASATIIDRGARRILKKYNLDLSDLFAGEAAVLQSIAVSNSVTEKLENLKGEVDGRMADLEPSVSDDAEFSKLRNGSKERIVYQITKLRDRFENAEARKRQIMKRHVRRVCNLLAPKRQRQERELSILEFLLRYGTSVMNLLHENLDIANFDHQLIYMD